MTVKAPEKKDCIHYAYIFLHIPLLLIALFTSTGMEIQESGTP